jgi:hypothetical protein
MSLNFHNSREDNAKQLIMLEFERILESIFESNKEVLNGFNEFKTIDGWYKESKEDPHKIPGIILNHCVSKIVQNVQPDLKKYFIDTFKIKIGSNKEGFFVDHIELKFSTKPFVKFVRKIDGIESGATKLVFEISLTGKMENIQFRSVMNYYEVNVRKIVASFDISVIEGSIALENTTIHPIKKPVKLFHKEILKLENIDFIL